MLCWEKMYTNSSVLALAVGGTLVWASKKVLGPQPPKICGSPNGPPVTSPRIKLRDGRNLAYREVGVPRETAKYRFIIVHGFDSSKDLYIPLSQEFMEKLGIYIVAFDRPGYGESDPNPNKTIKTETLDLLELADSLDLGSRFYVIGLSMGNYITWGCLKYIPHRLAGAALVVPAINYWWPSFPPKLFKESYASLSRGGKRNLWIAHHAPWLLHWWMTQKWFDSAAVTADGFPACDVQLLKFMSRNPNPNLEKATQQGEYESLHRDPKIAFGKWEFDPMKMENPFPLEDDESRCKVVHLWQGYDDVLVPYQLQRFVAQKLPWIKYHEVPQGIGGHFIFHDRVICESIFKNLLLVEEQVQTSSFP